MPARLPLFPSPSMLFVRRAMVEGFRGRNRVWRMVMYGIILSRLWRRLMGSDPRTVAVERLRPGETLLLRGVTSRTIPEP
jgi:hypothetical protein